MIYIVYERNKTNTILLAEELYIMDALMKSGAGLDRISLREEENEELTTLFVAMCNELQKIKCKQRIQDELKEQMNALCDNGLLYVSSIHMMRNEEVRYLVCLENDMVSQGEGIVFIVYHSDLDDAIACTCREGQLRVFLNLTRLKKDNLVSKFAHGLNELMIKEPSIQLLGKVCDMDPLFINTFPYILMFLCNANRAQIKLHSIQESGHHLH